MKHRNIIKLLFVLLITFVFATNVDAGLTTDTCGSKGRINVTMTSSATYAGFDTRENICNWQYSGMVNVGSYTTAQPVIDSKTSAIRAWTSQKTAVGNTNVGDGYSYLRCTDPLTTVTGSGSCGGGYAATCGPKVHHTIDHPCSYEYDGNIYDCSWTEYIYKNWCCCTKNNGKDCHSRGC